MAIEKKAANTKLEIAEIGQIMKKKKLAAEEEKKEKQEGKVENRGNAEEGRGEKDRNIDKKGQ